MTCCLNIDIMANIGYNLVMQREKFISNLFSNFLSANETVLDVGMGNGFVAEQLAKNHQVKITGTDIANYNTTNLPFVLCSDTKLPFNNHSFDTVILVFTLHHCKNVIAIISEAKRVAKNKIIIVEDTYSNFFERIITITADILLNLSKPQTIHPGNFKTDRQWQEIFEKLNLTIIKKKIMPRQTIPLGQHIVYVLENE